jgi:hypothetical protein
MDKEVGRYKRYNLINNHEYERYPKEKQWIADFVSKRNQEIAEMKKFPRPKAIEKEEA